eukprot:522823-Pyramimonas_sp.AAC.1
MIQRRRIDGAGATVPWGDQPPLASQITELERLSAELNSYPLDTTPLCSKPPPPPQAGEERDLPDMMEQLGRMLGACPLCNSPVGRAIHSPATQFTLPQREG